jgi:histidine ammonia-lyase
VVDLIRTQVPPLEDDRPLSAEIETVAGLVRSGALLEAAQSVVGPLN